MLVYVNVFATYAHTYISKYIVLDALVSTYVPTHSQVGKSACIVLAKERHSKGERVPFSALN